jgi:hypothetical protein
MSGMPAEPSTFEMYFYLRDDGTVVILWGSEYEGVLRDNVVQIREGDALGNLTFAELAAAREGVISWTAEGQHGVIIQSDGPD